MLTKNKNPKVNYIARIMVLPLAVLIFAAFTFKTKNPAAAERIKSRFIFASNNSFSPNQMLTDTVPLREKIALDKALFVFNGKIIGKGKKAEETLNLMISAGTVDVKWLTRAEAVAKYGIQGEDGACEVNQKNIVADQSSSLVDYQLKEKMNSDSLLKLKQKLIMKETGKLRIDSIDVMLKQDPNLQQYLKLKQQDTLQLKLKQDLLFKVKDDGPLIKVKIYDSLGNYIGEKLMPIQIKQDYQKLNNLVFSQVETAPSFPGGQDEWKKYLSKNVNASLPVDEGWKAGKYTVIVEFIVHTDGTLSDIKTTNYKGSKTAQHCMDILRNSPRWIPAAQNGQKVNAYHKQPITFVVEEAE